MLAAELTLSLGVSGQESRLAGVAESRRPCGLAIFCYSRHCWLINYGIETDKKQMQDKEFVSKDSLVSQCRSRWAGGAVMRRRRLRSAEFRLTLLRL